MAESGAEMDAILQEWSPMSDLFSKIPTKMQNGIFNQDVSLTCVDILPEFIAVGSNLGVVYWYDRKKKDMQRLRCENANAKITTVKIISTVDYMVACGNCDGQISIFQIPKSHPDSLPESLKPKVKQVERYTVSELHTSSITSLEWSKNGMKLFSGDKNGLVVLTELDFYMHLSKSVDILNETYEVVQLSYCQQHLLVSTTYRTIVCQKQDKWKICQVGKKDRKSLGNYGGVFSRNGYKPKDILVYSTRPGLRIWVSDLTGTVQQTLLFKDLLNKECFEVPLINPITSHAKKLKPQREAMFGILLSFADKLLVTYSSEIIYILDPTNLLVIATISHLRRILSVATCKDELFVLEGERSLIRISFKPEPVISENTTNTIPTASTFLPLANSIKDLTNKLQTSSIISALPPLFENNLNTTDYNIHTDLTSVIRAEEACELSPVKKFPGTINLKITEPKIANITQDVVDNVKSGLECLDLKKDNVKKFEVFEKIGSEEFDDHILFKHRRRKKINLVKSEMTISTTSLSSTSSDEKDNSFVNRPCMLNVSTIGTIGTIVPDLRSPESILTDIENKEKILANMLNLDQIAIPVEKTKPETNTKINVLQNSTYSSPYRSQINTQKTTNMIDKSKENGVYVARKIPNQENGLSFNTKEKQKAIQKMDANVETNNTQKLSSRPQTNTMHYFQQGFSQSSSNYKNNSQKFVSNEAVINYGPPSGSSNPNSIDPPACLTIPNVWKLQELTVNQDASEASDSSLHDWEII